VGRYVLDFFCPKIRLAIELDGNQHMQEENKQYDEERTQFLNSQNIVVLRFYDNDVFRNISGIVDKIIIEIDKLQNITP
jgi:very-short-patch-repair endonuclease